MNYLRQKEFWPLEYTKETCLFGIWMLKIIFFFLFQNSAKSSYEFVRMDLGKYDPGVQRPEDKLLTTIVREIEALVNARLVLTSLKASPNHWRRSLCFRFSLMLVYEKIAASVSISGSSNNIGLSSELSSPTSSNAAVNINQANNRIEAKAAVIKFGQIEAKIWEIER